MTEIFNFSIDAIVLILRLSVVVFLYLFLWQALRVVTYSLQEGGQVSNNPVSPYGQLVIVASGQSGLPVGKAFPLNPVNVIGRSLESDIALNDNFMSAQHALLELRGNEWFLEDTGSTNGTFVNGFEVRDPTPINYGDIVRVGRVELRLTK
jgi:pSer/pThr/pTyr-binding forkhead associated (FHA) protein